jgi:hypothetical protein
MLTSKPGFRTDTPDLVESMIIFQNNKKERFSTTFALAG